MGGIGSLDDVALGCPGLGGFQSSSNLALFASGETFSLSFEGSVSVRLVGGGVGVGAIGFGAIGFAVGGTTSGSTGYSTVVSSSVEIVSSVGGCAVALLGGSSVVVLLDAGGVFGGVSEIVVSDTIVGSESIAAIS